MLTIWSEFMFLQSLACFTEGRIKQPFTLQLAFTSKVFAFSLLQILRGLDLCCSRCAWTTWRLELNGLGGIRNNYRKQVSTGSRETDNLGTLRI